MMLEITVISAQGIKNTTPFCFCFFSHHLKPFITITTFPPPLISGGNSCHVYSTRVDHEGGPNPIWGDKFHLPLDPTFFTSGTSYVYLQLYTLRAVLGPEFLGWIQIPASDLLDGLSPITSPHHLSYRIREKDGSRGHGVVNVALRFVGDVPVAGCFAEVDTWRTSIGIPVTTWSMTYRVDQMDNICYT